MQVYSVDTKLIKTSSNDVNKIPSVLRKEHKINREDLQVTYTNLNLLSIENEFIGKFIQGFPFRKTNVSGSKE